MFKDNYIKKLAFDNIKKQKKLYQYIFIALLMSFFLSTLVFILFASYQKIGYDERVSRYGMWSLAVENEQELKMPKQEGMLQGNVYFFNDVYFHKRKLGKLGTMDKNAQFLTSLTYIKGHYPQNENELAIEEKQLTFLGIESQLNQSIELTLNGVNKVYKIVGIIQNYSQDYQIPIPSFFTIGESQNYTILYKYKDNVAILNELLPNKQDQFVEVNYLTYNDITYDGIEYEEIGHNKYMEIFVVFIGFVGVLSTTFSSMNKRREYFILLRCLGATPFQIQKMVMYEGVFLMLLASVLGITFSMILSVLLIYLYHLIMNAPITIVMNWDYLPQLFYMYFIAFISMYIVSLSAYLLQLTGKVTQKSHHFRRRKIRKTNVFSLAFYELVDHQLVSFFLVVIVVIWAFFAHSSVSQLTGFFESRERYQDYGFQYTLDITLGSERQADISYEEYQKLSQLQGVTSQMILGNSIYYHYDAMNGESFFDTDEMIDGKIAYGHLCTYSNLDRLSQIFQENDFQGHLPQKENEVVVLLPYYSKSYYSKSGGSSLYADDNLNEYNEGVQIPLKIGDKVDIYPQMFTNNQKLGSLNVVGILQLKKETQKTNQLLYDHQLLITNNQTYQKLFNESSEQTILIDLDETVDQLQYKEMIFQLLNHHNQYEYSDNYAEMMAMKTRDLELFLKEITFVGVLLIGVTILIYTQRKLRVMSMRNEIGLLKAIGATQSQIFIIHTLYAFMVYMIGYVCYWGLIYLYGVLYGVDTLYWFHEIFKTSEQWITMIFFGIVFMIVMTCSAYHEIRKNPLDLIVKEE